MTPPRQNIDHLAQARCMLQRVATIKLFVKAAEIITATEPVSGSQNADNGILELIREELTRREFGTLSDRDLVATASQYGPAAGSHGKHAHVCLGLDER